jgi:hypothetical protein
VRRPFWIVRVTLGISIEARMPMMAHTTNTSVNV